MINLLKVLHVKNEHWISSETVKLQCFTLTRHISKMSLSCTLSKASSEIMEVLLMCLPFLTQPTVPLYSVVPQCQILHCASQAFSYNSLMSLPVFTSICR